MTRGEATARMLVLRILAFTMLVPGTVVGLVPWWMVRSRPQPLVVWSAPSAWLGLLLLATGAFIYGGCAWEFGVRGRGTPAPFDPPRALVVTGLYRYTRNPMYVGVLLAILGEALLFGSSKIALYGAGVGACFQTFIVLHEEPKLRRAFGPAFTEYCRSVSRWIPLPWPRRSAGEPDSGTGEPSR